VFIEEPWRRSRSSEARCVVSSRNESSENFDGSLESRATADQCHLGPSNKYIIIFAILFARGAF